MSGNVRWIRVDPDCLFIRRIQITQTLPMWLHQVSPRYPPPCPVVGYFDESFRKNLRTHAFNTFQLQCDGDIGGQLEAIEALVTFRDRAVVSALNATMANKKVAVFLLQTGLTSLSDISPSAAVCVRQVGRIQSAG